MSLRDRNRNYADSQRHPAGYWLAFAVGVVLFVAAILGLLLAIARSLAADL